jgi:hypothetical protein
MSIKEYRELTGYDPVSEHIRRQYVDHLEMQETFKKEGFTPENILFDNFYKREMASLRLNN